MPSFRSLACLPGETGAELLNWQDELAEPLRVQEARRAAYDKQVAEKKPFFDFQSIDQTGPFRNTPPAIPAPSRQGAEPLMLGDGTCRSHWNPLLRYYADKLSGSTFCKVVSKVRDDYSLPIDTLFPASHCHNLLHALRKAATP